MLGSKSDMSERRKKDDVTKAELDVWTWDRGCSMYEMEGQASWHGDWTACHPLLATTPALTNTYIMSKTLKFPSILRELAYF